jgi:hypothetical protein
MISILLLWGLVTLCVFSFGVFFSKILFLFGVLHEEEMDFYKISFLGITALSAILAIISLFNAIDSNVFYVLTTLSIIPIFLYRKQIIKIFQHPAPWGKLLFQSGIAILVLLMS